MGMRKVSHVLRLDMCVHEPERIQGRAIGTVNQCASRLALPSLRVRGRRSLCVSLRRWLSSNGSFMFPCSGVIIVNEARKHARRQTPVIVAWLIQA
jgi:hypothetical protein